MLKIIILVFVVICIFYRCTKNFNLDLVEIKSWEYSTKCKYYIVEFTWTDKNSTLTGLLISDEPPSEGERYVVAGYDVSKKMWHIIKQKKK